MLRNPGAEHERESKVHLKSIFFSGDEKSFANWSQETVSGKITRVTDKEIQSKCVNLIGDKKTSVCIWTPSRPNKELNIDLRFLNFVLKNLGSYCSMEFEIRDCEGNLRCFHARNFISRTRISFTDCYLPLRLQPGWNKICIDLQKFTEDAFGIRYSKVTRMKIYSNCSLRRIYFSDKMYSEQELPAEYKTVISGVVEKKENPEVKPLMVTKPRADPEREFNTIKPSVKAVSKVHLLRVGQPMNPKTVGTGIFVHHALA